MQYKLFGRTGLRVSELALGAMTFGKDWGWGATKQESKKMFNAFAEAGGNFITPSLSGPPAPRFSNCSTCSPFGGIRT